jgi:hypothetical protein
MNKNQKNFRPGFDARRGVCALLFCATVVLASCGGGGGDAAPTTAVAAASKDIAGLWADAGDPKVSGSTIGLFLTVGDVGYGVETTGNTQRYFRGTGFATDGAGFVFAQSRFDKSTGSTAAFSYGATPTNGKLTGILSSSNALDLSFSTTGAVNDFVPLRLTPGAPNTSVVADLRDFVGSFPVQPTSLKITAASADSGTLSAKGILGCDWSGSITRPRVDKNVWAVRLTQSACVDSARNSAVSEGLATMFASGTSKGLILVAFDGTAWSFLTATR